MNKNLNLDLGSQLAALEGSAVEVVAKSEVQPTQDVKVETEVSIEIPKKDIPTVKIGLDMGASSIKVSYMDQNGMMKDFSFLNRINENTENVDGTTVSIGNEQVKVGGIGGTSNANPKKVNYRYVRHILFKVAYELKKALGIDGDIKLEINTCLPPKQFKANREEFKQLLNISPEIGFVNAEAFSVYIEGIRCGAEGVVLLKAFNINSVAKDLMKVMLLDVGSSTTDIILLENMGDNVWKIKNAATSTAAGASMCQDIENYLNKAIPKGQFEWDELEMQGKYQVYGEVKPITTDANQIDRTVKALLNDIDKVGTFVEYMPLLAGQGSMILSQNKLFQETTKFLLVDNENLKYGNSRGCLKS